jgi:hypothetical protein
MSYIRRTERRGLLWLALVVGASTPGCINKNTSINSDSETQDRDEGSESDAGSIRGPGSNDDEDDTAPGAESEPTTEPTPEDEPEPSSEPDAQPEPVPEPDAQPESTPDPEPGVSAAGGAGGAAEDGGAGGEAAGGASSEVAGCSVTDRLQLTDALDDVTAFAAAGADSEMLLAFGSKPTGSPQLTVATWDGSELGEPTVVAEGNDGPIDGDPTALGVVRRSDDFLVAWYSQDQSARAQAITIEGAVDEEVYAAPSANSAATSATTLAWSDGATYARWGSVQAVLPDVGGAFSHGTGMGYFATALGVEDGLALLTAHPQDPSIGWVGLFDEVASDPTFNEVQGIHVTAQLDTVAAWDGEAISAFGWRDSHLYYDRITLGGTVAEFQDFGTFPEMNVYTTIFVPSLPGDGASAALFGNDVALYMLERSRDGERVIEPELVLGGESISNVHLLWDGSQYVIFWTDSIDGVRQVQLARVTCTPE